MKKVWLESWKTSGIHKIFHKALKILANTFLSQCFLDVLSEKNVFLTSSVFLRNRKASYMQNLLTRRDSDLQVSAHTELVHPMLPGKPMFGMKCLN